MKRAPHPLPNLRLLSLSVGLLTLGCTSSSGSGQSPASGGRPALGGAGGTSGAGASTGGSSGAGASTAGGGSQVVGPDHWVGTWMSSQQLTETNNNPPAPGLAHNTLRQFAYVTLGGSELRIQFSNEYGNGPVTLASVHLAKPTTGDGIDATTDTALHFAGANSVTIPVGEAVISDPFEFALAPQTSVAVTIHFGEVPTELTGHPGSRTTSYLVEGDAVSSPTFTSPVRTDHWYYLSGIEVMAPGNAAAVVALGDSLTDGRGSTTNGNDRWPDALSRRLRANPSTALVAVLNAGIGGNAVLSGGLGPTALRRFERDVLDQAGVRWVIVQQGVNDIGSGSPVAASNLINAYGKLIDAAHGRGLKIYGAPLLPLEGSIYDGEAQERSRQTVNEWFRTSGRFDAVLDFDAVVRDPTNPTRLNPAYDSGDRLHLEPAGYQALADSIDLALFEE